MEIIIHSPAKVNLLLRVVGRRADGYHEIRSVFQMISLKDTITFAGNDSGMITIACDNPSVPTGGGNLIIKAAEALRLRGGVYTVAKIELKKRIPVGAGLGGGSSNAAAALIALNKLWGINLPRETLFEIGETIGADVPFFLGTSPVAWVEGTGEMVYPLTAAKKLPLLLVNPGFEISAADAYKNSRFDFAPQPRDRRLIDDISSGEPERAAARMSNDLQGWALGWFEKLRELKEKMEASDPKPLKVMMSGSGPTLFAVYRDTETRDRAEAALSGEAPFVAGAETLTSLWPKADTPA